MESPDISDEDTAKTTNSNLKDSDVDDNKNDEEKKIENPNLWTNVKPNSGSWFSFYPDESIEIDFNTFGTSKGESTRK